MAEAGYKEDEDKNQLDLIPPELVFAVGEVMTYGAKKYAPYNWAKGMKWSRVFAALMRHLWAWWAGRKSDPETGMSDLHHAACCIAFLIAYEQRGSGEDDRFKS